MKKTIFRSCTAFLLVLIAVLPILALGASASYEQTAEWTNENPHKNDDYAFSIAVVGDTQTLVEMDTTDGTNYLSSIYDWIVANKDEKNMQYVLGLGDITQYDTDKEWTHAKAEITKMNGVVPYTLVRGGEPHDTKKQLDNYFANEVGYTENLKGYYEEGSVANTYSTFTYGENKFLIFSLDFAAVDAVLEWAGEVIESEQFKDYRVIITTHSYLYKDGNPCSQKTPSTAIPDKEQYTSDDKYNNGDEMWDKFISKHENIFLVLSGHFESNDIIASQAVGDNGNVVTQMMINPQGFDYKQKGETGMVCMLYFSTDGNQVSVEWYSTYRNQFYKPSNQFDIDLTTMSLGGGVATKYGYITARNYDPDNYPYALFKKTPSVGGDGTKYDYTFYGAYKTLVGDANSGATANESALHIAREKVGDGAVILLLRDVVNTDTSSYTNLQYHTGSLTIDLDDHTLTDKHTYSTALFFCHMKTANNHMTLTVKNGTLLVGNNGLTQYDGFENRTNSSVTVNFEDMTIGYVEGSTSSTLIKSYAADKEYSGCFPVNFNNCTIDMANAPDGAKIASASTGETITFIDSKIENSKLPYIINEYGCTTALPGENELIAVYKKVASNTKMDGVTYPSEYTFYGYYKALYDDSNLDVTTTKGAFHAARTITENGDEAVITLLDNHEVTTTSAYSNMCYNLKNIVFDLRGYTLTDSNTDTVTIFYMNARKAEGGNSIFTVTNGNIVLGSDAIASFVNPAFDFTMGLVFDNINFSWKEEGTKADYLIGKTAYRDNYPVTFNNCVIDLANAKSTMKLENGSTLAGITINNTKVLNSTDSKVYTADESDLLDGNYTFTKYGIIPLLAYENVDEYPFVAYKNSAATVNGVTYSYVYYGSYKVLNGDSSVGVTADSQLGISALRYAGNGAVLLMMRDYVYTADKNYTNLCYNAENATFDLGGYTLTEAQNHGTTALFHNHLKYADQNAGLTVKNGSIVLSNNKGLLSYDIWDAGATSKLSMVFEDLNISLANNSDTTYLVGKFTKAAGCYSVTFNNCVIDLANAPDSFNLMAQGSSVDGISLTLTDTRVTGSGAIAPQHNVTLNSDFMLNAYVPTQTKNGALTVSSIEFGGVKYELADLVIENYEGTNYYKVSLYVTPNAALTASTLRVNLKYTYTYSDGTTKVTESYLDWEFSVLTHLEDLILDANSTEETVTLARDTLSYIRAIYVYEKSAFADEVIAFVDRINGTDYDATSTPTDVEEKLIIDGMKSAQIRLESAPAFIFYPAVDENGDLVYGLDKYTFALDGEYLLTATAGVDSKGNSYLLISLPAYAVNGTIEYVIEGTDIHGYYNLQAYYNYFKNGTDADLISLIERLKKYGESAAIYRSSIS